jgi:hypothetical protein
MKVLKTLLSNQLVINRFLKEIVMNKNLNARYEVMIYDGHETTVQAMERDQAMAINRQSVDHFMSISFGTWAFRTADGQWVEHTGADWPGLGDTCIKIIQALQLNPGEFLTPDDIVELTGFHTLRNSNALSARLKAIREVHKETFRKPHFFLSRRSGGFGVSWNPQSSWASVERIAPSKDFEPSCQTFDESDLEQ